MQGLRTGYPAVSMDNGVDARLSRTRVFRPLPRCSTTVYSLATRPSAGILGKGLSGYGKGKRP